MVVWNANGGGGEETTIVNGLYNGTLTIETNFSWGLPYGGTVYSWPNWKSTSVISIINGAISQPGNPTMVGPSGGTGRWDNFNVPQPPSGWAKPLSASVSWTPTNRTSGQSKYYKIIDDEWIEISYEEYMELPENKESPS